MAFRPSQQAAAGEETIPAWSRCKLGSRRQWPRCGHSAAALAVGARRIRRRSAARGSAAAGAARGGAAAGGCWHAARLCRQSLPIPTDMWGQSPLAIVLTCRLNYLPISDLSRSLNCLQTVRRFHLSPTFPPLLTARSPCAHALTSRSSFVWQVSARGRRRQQRRWQRRRRRRRRRRLQRRGGGSGGGGGGGSSAGRPRFGCRLARGRRC